MKTRTMDSQADMLDVISRCEVCYMGMVDEEGLPYVVPMNFGFHDGSLYLHGAQFGRKMSILQRNKSVSIAFSTDHELRAQHEETACSYSMKSRSVIIQGEVEFIEDLEGKAEALNVIMRHYTNRDFTYREPALREVACYKVIVRKMSGRIRGY